MGLMNRIAKRAGYQKTKPTNWEVLQRIKAQKAKQAERARKAIKFRNAIKQAMKPANAKEAARTIAEGEQDLRLRDLARRAVTRAMAKTRLVRRD